MASGVPLASLATGVEWLTNPGGQLTAGGGRSVYIYTRGTTTPVSVFSDQGLSTPLTQPLVTGSTGAVPGFIAAEQKIDFYDVVSGLRAQAEPLAIGDLIGSDGHVGGSGSLGLPTSVVTDSSSSPKSIDSTGVTNGEALIYNSGAGKWEPGSAGTSLGPGALLVEGQLESLTPVLERKRTQVSPTLMAATNAASALTIATPDSSGQVVEPAVEYIPWGWNGHKYWALITGYTGGSSTFEEPSLYYSDDGQTFTSAGAGFFPIIANAGGHTYADPEIVLGPDNKLHLFAVDYTSTTTAILWWTYDGTTLTGPTTILGPTANTIQSIVAPVFYWDGANNQWVMFYTDAASSFNSVLAQFPYKRRTCSGTSPGGTWSSATTTTVNGVPAGMSIWESHIAQRGEELHMVTTCCTETSNFANNGQNCAIYFGVSDDGGLTWTLGSAPILSVSGGSAWDSARVYRGDIVALDDANAGTYQLYYSAANSTPAWFMGLTTITRHLSASSVGGVTISGTPLTGQILTATGASTANWQPNAGGGAGTPVTARAHRVAALSLSAGTWTKVPLDTLDFDTGTNMDVATDHRYNVPATGYYKVEANCYFAGGSYGYVGIYHNGTLVSQGGGGNSSGTFYVADRADTLSCTAGDTIELYAFANGATSLNVTDLRANSLAVTAVH